MREAQGDQPVERANRVMEPDLESRGRENCSSGLRRGRSVAGTGIAPVNAVIPACSTPNLRPCAGDNDIDIDREAADYGNGRIAGGQTANDEEK